MPSLHLQFGSHHGWPRHLRKDRAVSVIGPCFRADPLATFGRKDGAWRLLAGHGGEPCAASWFETRQADRRGRLTGPSIRIIFRSVSSAEGALMRRHAGGRGCGARARASQARAQEAPASPSAGTTPGCLQWLDAAGTKAGGSPPDKGSPWASPLVPPGSYGAGDRKAAMERRGARTHRSQACADCALDCQGCPRRKARPRWAPRGAPSPLLRVGAKSNARRKPGERRRTRRRSKNTGDGARPHPEEPAEGRCHRKSAIADLRSLNPISG